MAEASRARYYVEEESNNHVTIADIGDLKNDMSVLNEISLVVRELHEHRVLKGRALFLFDQFGHLVLVKHDGNGRFIGVDASTGRPR